MVPSTDGRAAIVDYALATFVGGAPPVSVVCTPSSGASFPVGSTAVSCVASDSLQRTAVCSFNVAVQAPPRVSAVTYTAFGDSITEGLKLYSTATAIPSPPGSYPAQLHTLLSSRYTAQSILVYDEGIGGETIAQGMNRLRPVLISEHPDALLLLEGTNDLNGGGSKEIPTVVNGLKAMVQEGRSRGATVFLGTLLPQRAGGPRAFAPTLIQPTNDGIRAMADAQGAVLVDVYAAFGGDAGSLIGDDGLHPNDAGKLKIAETFFAAIRSRLELAPLFAPSSFR
jgi:lysophospholipase L1-like esterase